MGILVFKAACLIKKIDKAAFLRGGDKINHVDANVSVTKSSQARMPARSIIIRIKECVLQLHYIDLILAFYTGAERINSVKPQHFCYSLKRKLP